MDDSPTTVNGPLHNPAADLGERRIVAIFGDLAQAREARERLLQLGIPAERIELVEHAPADREAAAASEPADKNLIGRIRNTVWPDHGAEAYRDCGPTRRPHPCGLSASRGGGLGGAHAGSGASEAFRSAARTLAQYGLSRRAGQRTGSRIGQNSRVTREALTTGGCHR